MKKYPFKNPQFITSAVKPSGYPKVFNESGVVMPEIAVVGRSNVGKSTLINHLFKHKKMAKTSSTPGKTQLLNFFTIDDEIAFCDLPGYGFAKVPEKIRKEWGPMIETYLTKRDSLKLVLFLFDIRRIPNQDDLKLLEWIIYHQKAMILVLTKVDKVSKNEKVASRKKILDTFGAENMITSYYSATKNVGRQELIKLINEALAEEMEEGAR